MHRGPSGDFLVGLAGAIVLTLVAFVASGGIDLAPNSWVQAGLLILAAVVALAVILVASPGRAWGAVTLLLFAALAVLTYASIAWSVQPANSWLEANRTLSYLAAFGAALMLARLAPRRWRALVGAVATATTVVCAYALLVKVFPGSLDSNDPLGRLQAPFDYWNAVGLMGAMGIPPCLWAGARRGGAPWLRALTVPAISILVPALLLAFSRGAIIAAVFGLGVWFALAPLRLRSTLILALGALGGGVISAWGIATRGISADGVAAAARTSAGHTFGVVVLVVLVLATAAGFGAVRALDRVRLSSELQRRIGSVLIGLVALIPVAAVLALAASPRGLTGEVSHLWNNLTNPNGVVSDRPGRLINLSNSRPHYWSEAIHIGRQHPVAGVGALGFATAQVNNSNAVWNPQHAHVVHAHGYLFETFADFGVIGVALSLALFAAWGLATARTLEFGRLRRRVTPASAELTAAGAVGGTSAERTGLIALLAVTVTFGVHSLIDWTWFIPGNAVTALCCAGWLAGRGPVSQVPTRLERRRLLSRSPMAALVAALSVVVTVLAVWVIVQPLRSSDAYNAAFNAALHGNGGQALTDARSAAVEDPVSVDPLFLLAQIYSHLGNTSAARRELTDAVSRQPGNPETWSQLACFDYSSHSPSAAGELHRVLVLNPSQTEITTDPSAWCASVTD